MDCGGLLHGRREWGSIFCNPFRPLHAFLGIKFSYCEFQVVCLFLLWSKCFWEFSSLLVFPENLTFCSILWSLLVRVLNASMFWIIFSAPCRIDLWSCLMCWLNAEASLVSVNLLVLCDCGMGNTWMSYIWSCHWNIFLKRVLSISSLIHAWNLWQLLMQSPEFVSSFLLLSQWKAQCCRIVVEGHSRWPVGSVKCFHDKEVLL